MPSRQAKKGGRRRILSGRRRLQLSGKDSTFRRQGYASHNTRVSGIDARLGAGTGPAAKNQIRWPSRRVSSMSSSRLS
jgi:hypothetical protein